MGALSPGREMVLFCLGQFGPRRSVLAAGLHCESVLERVVQVSWRMGAL